MMLQCKNAFVLCGGKKNHIGVHEAGNQKQSSGE